MRARAQQLCSALLLAVFVTESNAELFIDHSFSCPIKTAPAIYDLCGAICVGGNITECPPELACASGETLCPDGNCYAFGAGVSCEDDNARMINSCSEVCGFACPANVYSALDYECADKFSDLYAAQEEGFCLEVIDEVPYDAPGFLFFYIWLAVLASISLSFCFFNQRISPKGRVRLLSVDPLEAPVAAGSHAADVGKQLQTLHAAPSGTPVELDDLHLLADSHPAFTQIGYKSNWLGNFLYTLVMLTVVGFQVVLMLLTIVYYNVTDVKDPDTWFIPFEDEVQALKVFEIVWMVGFAWCLVIKWPSSVRDLFRRRAELSEAEYVYVFSKDTVTLVSNIPSVARMKKGIDTVMNALNMFCVQLFSDVSRPSVAGRVTVCKVNRQADGSRSITFQLRKFVYNHEAGRFQPAFLEVGKTLRDLIGCKPGLNSEIVALHLSLVGPNLVEVKSPTVVGVLVSEFSKVFYLYQNFMTWTWFNFAYWHMGISNMLVYVTGGLTISFLNYRNQLLLSSIAKLEGSSRVIRNGVEVTLNSSELVPGDVVVLSAGPVTCDMVMLEGQVLVDESSLTGESMPVAKVAAEDLPVAYSPSAHKKNTLFAGTTILKDESRVGLRERRELALVLKTGANTSKGEQIRDILFATAPQFKFDIQVKVVIGILCCYAIFGFLITLHFLDSDPTSGWFYAMYVVSSALPPLLPTVFVVSVGISSDRLRTRGIVCSVPERILMAGKVRVACFDKTGTLTKQGLDFLGVRALVHRAADDTLFAPLAKSVDGAAVALLSRAMACTHFVTLTDSGTLIGNSVDVKMFEASGWALTPGHGAARDVVSRGAGAAGDRLTLRKRFDFDHHRMTMSAVAFDEAAGGHIVFVKGSAEKVRSLCLPASLPSDFVSVSDQHSRDGCYVIALGARRATPEEEAVLAGGARELDRDAVEAGFDFVGLLLFRNELKPDSAAALAALRAGDVRTVMISGDHPLTAIHIAHESGLVGKGCRLLFGRSVMDGGEIEWLDEDGGRTALPPLTFGSGVVGGGVELAVVGDVFRNLYKSDRLEALLPFIRVYARMQPGDKVAVVEEYVRLGFITAMCGDGANDCGALRASHVGVALSDAEASVVSPFTGLNKSAMDVVEVLLEGRCGLASAFASYKYMIMYGQVETIIQIINAYFAITFSEWCWVFMDGFWVITMAFSLPFANRAPSLAAERPPSSLLGAYTIASAFGVLAINFFFIVIALAVLFAEDWFSCRKWTSDDVSSATVIGDNYESTVLFVVAGWQYVSSAMAFNFGFLHRAPWIVNWRFVFFVVAFAIIHLVIVLVPSELSCFVRINCEGDDIVRGATYSELLPIQNPFHTTLMPVEFRWKLVGLAVGNTVAVMLWEKGVVVGPIGRWFRQKFRQTKPLNL